MSNIYSALREAYQQLGTPLESDSDPGIIENALTASGYSLGVDAGRLIATRENHMVPVEPALRTLALQQQNAHLFVLPISRVTKLSQLKTAARRSQFIAERGLSEWTRLVQEKK